MALKKTLVLSTVGEIQQLQSTDVISHAYAFTMVGAQNTTNGVTFLTVGYLVFPGTNQCSVSKLELAFNRQSGTGTGNYQIIDVSNANAVIASGSGVTAAYPNIITNSSLSNLSSGLAIWELQINHTAPAAVVAYYYARMV